MNKTTSPTAIQLVIRHYFAQLKKNKLYSVFGLFLPGVGNILAFYVPPLIIAQLIERYAKSNQSVSVTDLLPYLLVYAGVLVIAEILYRIAIHYLIKLEAVGLKQLYNQSISYLLVKDLGFFSNNFTGSLTKKSVSYAKGFEGVMDTLAFDVIANIVTLVFVVFVLWQFSPFIVLALLIMLAVSATFIVPLIRRRQKLVVKREAASNVLSGHISDVITNMSAVHSFAREDEESTIHHLNVKDYVSKAKKSWDYQNLRIDINYIAFVCNYKCTRPGYLL